MHFLLHKTIYSQHLMNEKILETFSTYNQKLDG